LFALFDLVQHFSFSVRCGILHVAVDFPHYKFVAALEHGFLFVVGQLDLAAPGKEFVIIHGHIAGRRLVQHQQCLDSVLLPRFHVVLLLPGLSRIQRSRFAFHTEGLLHQFIAVFAVSHQHLAQHAHRERAVIGPKIHAVQIAGSSQAESQADFADVQEVELVGYELHRLIKNHIPRIRAAGVLPGTCFEVGGKSQ